MVGSHTLISSVVLVWRWLQAETLMKARPTGSAMTQSGSRIGSAAGTTQGPSADKASSRISSAAAGAHEQRHQEASLSQQQRQGTNAVAPISQAAQPGQQAAELGMERFEFPTADGASEGGTRWVS